MNKKTYLLSFIIIGLLGTLWHFIYEWSDINRITGIFSPVNESTWEHLKILFFPTLIYSLFEYLFCKEKPGNYIPASVISVVVGMITIVATFYTYTGILGYNISIIDISTFFLGLFAMLAIKALIIKKGVLNSFTAKIISVLIILIIIALFGIWTFYTPSIAVFAEP